MPAKVLIAVAILGAGAVAASAVFAADTETGGGLQEIVVTAQKREETAQNVAISMSVISGGDLAAKSITYVNDLANATPSLQVEPAFGSSQPEFRLRGIGFIDYTSNNTSPVGVNVDGVALALPIQTQGQLFDIDRVEVLRGPQGTLYGRNSTGGTINFITNQPTQDTHFGGDVEWGTHNLVNVQAFASGTIAPTLTGRLSVATEQGGAWQRDRSTGESLGDKDQTSVRGQLQWTPSDWFDAHAGLHWAQDKSDEEGLYLLKPYPVLAGAPVQIPADTSPYITGWHLNPVFAGFIGLPDDAKPGLNNSNYGIDLTGNVNVGFAKLTSITSWDKQIRREYGDWDATQFDDSDEFFNSGLQVFSEELRLASGGSGALQWVVGGIYANEDLTEDFYSDVLHAPVGGGVIALTSYEQAVNSVGVFGQASYQINDQFKVSLGVREDHENRELLNLNTSFLAGFVESSTTGGPLDRVAVSNLPSGKFELDYKPLTDTLLYASVSRGVKSGGFTAHNTFSGSAVDPFEPEKLTAYELGVKSDITHTLRVNAAGYYYRYHDQQILSVIQSATALVGKFTNADSRISGGEVEVDWAPVRGLNVTQYAGFVEGYYTSALFNALRPGVNYQGTPESIPKWSYGGDASYALPFGDYQLTPELNYSFHDTYSQWFLLNSADYTIPKYWLANANLTFSPANGPWSVALWGRNITNRRYDLTRNFFLQTSEVAAAGEPATWGIRFSVKY